MDSTWLDRQAAAYRPYAYPTMRVGLGLVILFAGLHKFVDPAAWGQYTAQWTLDLWPVSMTLTMYIAGVTEVPVGVLLLVNRYTTLAAALVAISMAGLVVYLVAVVVTTGGQFVDILIRDTGILVLAIGVTLLSVEK